MIETKVETINDPDKDLPYPLMARRKGIVVLFAGPTTGTVLESDGDYVIGHYDEEWVDINEWEILSPESRVILRNK